MKSWYTIWIYGGTDFQGNDIEKHPSHIHLFLLKLLDKKFTLNLANNHNLVLIIAEKFTKNS